MALECLCSDIIVKNKKITIPGGATHYNRKCKKKVISFLEERKPLVRFFKVNPGHKSLIKIPCGAEIIEFPHFEEFKYHINYGNPVFYDANGNVLKHRRY